MEQLDTNRTDLLEVFEDLFDDKMPWDFVVGPLTGDYEHKWTFYVAEGIGILKVTLRDVHGNEEDFEWESHIRNP